MSDFDTVTVKDVPADATILDVREDYEWSAGHAEGALHIPRDQLPGRLDDLDPDEELYVICRTGGRSFRAAQWLVGQGYSAVNVAGGMDQWLESGKPLVSDNGLKPVVLSALPPSGGPAAVLPSPSAKKYPCPPPAAPTLSSARRARLRRRRSCRFLML